jgi:CRP/FNR family transcriptional regulator, cyclic AMP receptor protein
MMFASIPAHAALPAKNIPSPEGKPEPVVPKVSQEMLAEMIGTTRSRVSFLMNWFRKSDFLDYDGGGLQVHSSLLNVILHD